ncbi:hypothetical protein NDU88_005428 [Pleurodeles waltl]|uniref:Uncharacterized protein n=1 Tax=Pleurodeles waltl TaxID=8319 RepID=A0AAV7RNT4_PLEWA|nr:hypothetical protein NDU88_005428 [Pleurodeles waltl]
MLLYPARLRSCRVGNHTFSSAQRRCGDGWRCGTRWLLVDRRELEASPDGPLGRRARTGDHMALGGWRNHVTGLRYSKMEAMAVVPADSVGGTALEQDLEVGGDAEMT